MSNIEKFHLTAGITGFVADIVALASLAITFFNDGQRSSFANLSIKALMIFLAIYGWFSVCWFIVRAYYKRHGKESSKGRGLNEIIISVVLGTALILQPLLLPVLAPLIGPVGDSPRNSGFAAYIFIVGMLALIIGTALYFLMPVFYPDIEADTT